MKCLTILLAMVLILLSGAPLTGPHAFPTSSPEITESTNYFSYQWHLSPDNDIDNIRITDKNALLSSDSGRHWVYLAPEAFQVIGGQRNPVEMALIPLDQFHLGLKADGYDKTKELVIRLEAEKCYSSGSTTYYIRPDGGTAAQCTGTSDAPYPGSGSNQPCAWSHPFWALNANGTWKIQGGDTIIISAGSYMMGFGAPNTSGWCDISYTYDCDLPPLPSGPDAAHPTRILGKGWDSGCSNPPELWGTQRPWNILDLTGSSNIYIGCLEITDHSDCIESHSNPSVRCERDNYPYGDWAAIGIQASDSSNVTLKHLDIHGLAGNGVVAGRLADWTIEDVRIAGNGWAGWDGDLPAEEDSNSGTILFNRVTIEWNGCGETFPGKQPHNCWAQTAGGYGDGLGTGTTGGHWIFRDCLFRYNTSDGLDLLYVRNNGGQIDIQRTIAYGNAGNAVKTTGSAAIENCLLIGNCSFFNGKSFTYHVDDCRALGSTLVFDLMKGSTVSVVNCTIAGQGDCLLGSDCYSNCNGSETIIIKNNIFQGSPDFLSPGDTTCYLWLDDFNLYNLQMDYNILYDVKITDALSLSANDIQADPTLMDSSLESFDGKLRTGSPAIDSGLAVGSSGGLIPSVDIEGNRRPAGSGVDRGAYEFGGTGGDAPPFGSFEIPADGETVRSSIPVSGWALDDAEVTSVKIYRGDTGDSNDMIYIGDAVLVEGARPDVTQAFLDYPNNTKAGWGYMMLTNFLPDSGNGTFTLYAVASDDNGNSTTLGSKTIICDNTNAVNPFGAIDTPQQGATVSGRTYINWGWVLTPQPNSIPTDGSTINVWVDGINLGSPVYNLYRSDIAALFPGYSNSNGAVGYFYLDTTTYTNGVHSIQWTATDTGKNTDGIGSRYFSIQNGKKIEKREMKGNRQLARKEATREARREARQETIGNSGKKGSGEFFQEDFTLGIRKGYRDKIPLRFVSAGGDGWFVIRLKLMERVEIHFPITVENQHLPVGSTMNPAGTTFYWQPGPAFTGQFLLKFSKKTNTDTAEIPIKIIIDKPF
jgi:hypothetical protein